MELRSATGQRFTTTKSSHIFRRTRDGVNMSGDVQIAAMTAGLQSSIALGGSVTEATSSCYRSSNRVRTYWWCVQAEILLISTESDRDRRNQDAAGLRARVRGAAAARPATLGNVPVLPSESEVEQHELTHLPFRRWCRHCVSRAKGAHTTSRVLAACRSSPQTTISWVRTERQSLSWLEVTG